MTDVLELPGGSYRWSLHSYVTAWEAGAFERRVELIEGDVVYVPIGSWHGRTQGRVASLLPKPVGTELTFESLVTDDSLPDPDCWIARGDVAPLGPVGRRMFRYPARAAALVVEVSDETRDDDLGRKMRLYARGGYAHYWVVTREGVYAHSEPHDMGYAMVRLHPRGSSVTVPYAPDVELAVDDLLAPED